MLCSTVMCVNPLYSYSAHCVGIKKSPIEKTLWRTKSIRGTTSITATTLSLVRNGVLPDFPTVIQEITPRPIRISCMLRLSLSLSRSSYRANCTLPHLRVRFYDCCHYNEHCQIFQSISPLLFSGCRQNFNM